jgi:hypothetical protein
VLAAGAIEHVSVHDGVSGELFRVPTPPFVSPATVERYRSVAVAMAGVDLCVEWVVRHWPAHGEVRWRQVFRDGIEQATGPPAPEPDLVVACDYRDLARFLIGVVPLTEAATPVRVVVGGIAELSCLGGLVLSEPSLRSVAQPEPLRRLLAEALASL